MSDVIQIAREKVPAFDQEANDLMKHHHEAMECRECETFLQHGIETLKFIRFVEETLKRAVVEFNADVSLDETGRAIIVLYRCWMRPVKRAQEWIKKNEDQGYELENLGEFHEALNYVRERISWADQNKLLDSMADGDVFTEDFLNATQAN